ncbi:solute carrier family 22 member [Acrasis kona]|uniref:Solute carrier family 22 member n=1 Tax=Acrasis kona TaxID=1008807 RepID=A0AAW2YWE4_9EUKA
MQPSEDNKKKFIKGSLYLGIQLMYIPFIFWFIELSQNMLTQKVTGDYGWYYPDSPYNWFSFQSVFSWGVLCIVFWNVWWWVLLAVRVNFWIKMLITTVIGWVTEYCLGYVAAQILGHPMQIWHNSPLIYVSYFAIVWWFQNSMIYYLLVIKIPTALYDSFIDSEDHVITK